MKTVAQISIFISIGILCIVCNPKKTQEKTEIPEAELPATEEVQYSLDEVWSSDTLFKTPESVIYDVIRQVFYVSNVNQNPWEKDNNGFISKMSKTGEILDLEWVSGFSGPKGMAIVDDILYVADLDELVLIDIEKSAIKDRVVVEGASGLNDITPGPDGSVYFSDSNEGKIFQYTDGEVSVFNGDAPGRPNGLLMVNGNLFAAFSQASDFVYYNIETLEKTVVATEIGAGDGVTPTNEENTFLVSDWNGEIFIINTTGLKQSLLNTIDQEKNTADIWFIQEENLLLVPTFFDNRVVAYNLNKK